MHRWPRVGGPSAVGGRSERRRAAQTEPGTGPIRPGGSARRSPAGRASRRRSRPPPLRHAGGGRARRGRHRLSARLSPRHGRSAGQGRRTAGSSAPPVPCSTTRLRCRRRTRSGVRDAGGRRRRARNCRRARQRRGHTGARSPVPRTRAPAAPPPGCPRPGRLRRRPRYRLHGADHLVTGDERERDDALEIAGATPVERGQVRPADAREHRVHVYPPRCGQRRCVHARRDAGPAPTRSGAQWRRPERAAAKRGMDRSKRSVLTVPTPPWAR